MFQCGTSAMPLLLPPVFLQPRQSIWKTVVFAVFLLALPLTVVAQAPTALDTRFLKEQPYRKMKQRVDLSGVTKETDLAVIKEGINPIMFFLGALAQEDVPVQKVMKIATSAGAQRLRLPPLQGSGRQRYTPREKFNWKVTGDSMITVTVRFHDMIRPALTYTDTYIFLKEHGEWKFDRYG